MAIKPHLNLPPTVEKLGQVGLFVAIGGIALSFMKRMMAPNNEKK